MTITPLPTTNLASKVKKGFMERKAPSQIRKRFYRAKTSLAKANTLLPSENVARTGENPSSERKML